MEQHTGLLDTGGYHGNLPHREAKSSGPAYVTRAARISLQFSRLPWQLDQSNSCSPLQTSAEATHDGSTPHQDKMITMDTLDTLLCFFWKYNCCTL